MSDFSLFPPPQATLQYEAQSIGHTLLLWDEVDSTNDLALAAGAQGMPPGTAFMARQQLAGRGQYGRVWTSPPDVSLLLSVLLPSTNPPPRPALLTAWVAISLAETLQPWLPLPIRLKWPNDLLVDEKKLCGILIEQNSDTVVGFGINLKQSADDFAALKLPQATSLRMAGVTVVPEPLELVRPLLKNLDQNYHRFAVPLGGNAVAAEAWFDWLGLRNALVECRLINQETYVGRLTKLNFQELGLAVEGEPMFRWVPEFVRGLRILREDSGIMSDS